MVVNFVCLVYMVALLVGCLGNPVLKVGIAEAVKKKRVTSCFGFKDMLGGYFCVSGFCIFQIYCGTMSNIS